MIADKPRRMTREARRADLLATAAAIVEADGAAALTFDALATGAGVAKALPYAYFASAEEILAELFEEVIGAVDRDVAAIVEAGGSFEAVLGGALDRWFDAVRDHGALVGALLDGAGVPGLRRAVRRRDRASQRLWEQEIATRSGLAGADVAVVAGMLNAGATATVQLWATRRGTRAALRDAFVAAVVGATSTSPPARRRARPGTGGSRRPATSG